MPDSFTATILDPKRAEEWKAILGSNTATVHIKSPIPTITKIPGRATWMPAYQLDAASLQPDQRERLVRHIAAKFQRPEASVNQELDEHGVPIPTDGCIVRVIIHRND